MPDPTQGRIGNVTVQKLPSTSPRPKKKLSHTVKARPSARIVGAFQPIATRVGFLRKR